MAGRNTRKGFAESAVAPTIGDLSLVQILANNRQKVTQAIRSLGLRVTAADVAATTGLPLWETIRELNRIAADAHAVLQVSNTGTLAYAFKGDPDAVYAAKGLNKAIRIVVGKAKQILFFAVRCSFGVLLLASILTLLVIFLVAIAFAMFASDAADGSIDFDGHGGGEHGGDFDMDLEWTFFDVVNLSMFFTWWRHDVEDHSMDWYGHNIQLRETGFISNCFSFLFGDGDPNRKYGERAWTYIADLIRLNNGVITAAQIGPYMEDYATDDGIFPVLVRFDGVPQVTATGNIVYQFPALQSTAAGHVFNKLPIFGELKSWKFSNVPARKLDFVFYFAGANLAGWWAIATNLHQFDFLIQYKPIVQLLLAYAIFFISVPIVRSLWNDVRNAWIEVKNKQREKLAKELAAPKMQAKIAEAQAFSTALQWHDPSQLAYTTAESLLDQELDVLPPLSSSPLSPLP